MIYVDTLPYPGLSTLYSCSAGGKTGKNCRSAARQSRYLGMRTLKKAWGYIQVFHWIDKISMDFLTTRSHTHSFSCGWFFRPLFLWFVSFFGKKEMNENKIDKRKQTVSNWHHLRLHSYNKDFQNKVYDLKYKQSALTGLNCHIISDLYKQSAPMELRKTLFQVPLGGFRGGFRLRRGKYPNK